MATPGTLILGIGNRVLGDDGIGIHLIERLAERHLPGVRCLDGGTLSFSLLEEVEGAERLIVADAAQLGEAPGTVRLLEGEEMERYLRSGRRSVHEVGLADLLDMARLTGRRPSLRALVAIQPLEIGWGDTPSPPLLAAIPHAIQEVEALLQRWNN